MTHGCNVSISLSISKVCTQFLVRFCIVSESQGRARQLARSGNDGLLRLAVAGSTCKDISTFGSQKGHFGESGETLAVWFAERFWAAEVTWLEWSSAGLGLGDLIIWWFGGGGLLVN